MFLYRVLSELLVAMVQIFGRRLKLLLLPSLRTLLSHNFIDKSLDGKQRVLGGARFGGIDSSNEMDLGEERMVTKFHC